MFKSVLCVCIGNVCRSPIAEGLLKFYSEKYNLGLQVSSAGTYALVDNKAQPYSIEVGQENGIDISNHIARQISTEMIYENEIILTMDDEVRQSLIQQFPFAVGKTKMIGHFNNKVIHDPYKKPKGAFEEMYRNIDDCLQDWLVNIWDVKLVTSA